jgi:hypothetical protein
LYDYSPFKQAILSNSKDNSNQLTPNIVESKFLEEFKNQDTKLEDKQIILTEGSNIHFYNINHNNEFINIYQN